MLASVASRDEGFGAVSFADFERYLGGAVVVASQGQGSFLGSSGCAKQDIRAFGGVHCLDGKRMLFQHFRLLYVRPPEAQSPKFQSSATRPQTTWA